MLGWVVQWKLPLPTALAWLVAPGDQVAEIGGVIVHDDAVGDRVVIPEHHLSPAPTGTGLGTYDRLPCVPTIETVTVLGVGVGVGVGRLSCRRRCPPPHRDAGDSRRQYADENQ